jgi:PucR C-terminal helix-turn-helix domain
MVLVDFRGIRGGESVLQEQKTGSLAGQPWAELPPHVADVLRPGIPALSLEIIDAIRDGVPAYARPLEGAFGAGVRVGVEEALTQFVDLVETPNRDSSAGRVVYVRLGRGEARAGRTLEALLAAYRIGARVAWRRVAEAARVARFGEDILARLAESIFAYIDELSAASAEGYAQEQAAAAGEAQRRRRHLVTLMIQSPPLDEAAVEEAARENGWQLPRSLAALVLRQPVRRIAARLPAETIVAPLDDFSCALVPDVTAPGRRRELEAALEGHQAVLGPTVPWQQAGVSARRAFALEQLVREGVLPANGLVVADDHLAALVLYSDRGLITELAQRRLAPLLQETENSRARLSETLLAWLDHQANVPEIAKALHIHPQTVRYRLGRLRERFGTALDDPQARFELGLALRAAAGPPAGATR